MTDDGDDEPTRGTQVVVVLDRDDDGAPAETITRRIPRSLTTKVEYRAKSQQNAVFDWNGTIRLDLSDEGLTGDRKGIIDIKYIEGGIFIDPDEDPDPDT